MDINTLLTVADLTVGKGVSMASMDYTAEVDLEGGKKNPYVGNVVKVVKGAQIMLYGHSGYAAKVQRHLDKEYGEGKVEFVVRERTWGKREEDRPIVHHIPKGETEEKLYLDVIFITEPTNVQYLYKGQPIARSEIVGWRKKKEAEQGGTSEGNKVYSRTFKAESIDELRAFSQVFV